MMNKVYTSDEYRIAVTEVIEILKYLPSKMTKQIPNNFIEFLKEHAISNYKPNFDYSKGLDKVNLSRKTKVLLAMIYREYICSQEEKKIYNNILVKNEEKYQEKLKEKYDPNNIFYSKTKTNKNEKIKLTNNNNLIEYKQDSIFVKIKKFIDKVLKKLNCIIKKESRFH